METKKWYLSKSIWAQIVGIVNAGLMMCVAMGYLPAKEGGIICGFIATVAGIVGVNGRLTATTTIKK